MEFRFRSRRAVSRRVFLFHTYTDLSKLQKRKHSFIFDDKVATAAAAVLLEIGARPLITVENNALFLVTHC